MALVGQAQGGLLSYTETFTGSGTRGAIPFDNVPIIFNGAANTADVTSAAGYYGVF